MSIVVKELIWLKPIPLDEVLDILNDGVNENTETFQTSIIGGGAIYTLSKDGDGLKMDAHWSINKDFLIDKCN